MEKSCRAAPGTSPSSTWPSSCVRDTSRGQVQVWRVHTTLPTLGTLTDGGPVGEAVQWCELYIVFSTESAEISHKKLNMDGTAGTAVTGFCN